MSYRKTYKNIKAPKAQSQVYSNGHWNSLKLNNPPVGNNLKDVCPSLPFCVAVNGFDTYYSMEKGRTPSVEVCPHDLDVVMLRYNDMTLVEPLEAKLKAWGFKFKAQEGG